MIRHYQQGLRRDGTNTTKITTVATIATIAIIDTTPPSKVQKLRRNDVTGSVRILWNTQLERAISANVTQGIVSYRVCYCGRLTKNQRRCDRCEEIHKAQNPRRASESIEGHGVRDNELRLLSKRYIGEHPLCEDCEELGYVIAAAEVHHVIPIRVDPSLRLEWTNLRALCIQHHSAADAKIRRAERLHAHQSR